MTLCNIYLPDFNRSIDDFLNISSQLSTPFIINGDFNAYNVLWSSGHTDARGRMIETLIEDIDVVLLNTGDGTYLNSRSNNFSAIDLTLCSPQMATRLSWSVMRDVLYSDHHPILIEITSEFNPTTNNSLRLATGAFRMSPIAALEVEAGIPPLQLRRERLMVNYAVNIKAQPHHPNYNILFNPHSEIYESRPTITRPLTVRLNREILTPDIYPKNVSEDPPWHFSLHVNMHSGQYGEGGEPPDDEIINMDLGETVACKTTNVLNKPHQAIGDSVRRTNVKPTIENAMTDSRSYNVVRKDRPNGKGGVAILIASNFIYHTLDLSCWPDGRGEENINICESARRKLLRSEDSAKDYSVITIQAEITKRSYTNKRIQIISDSQAALKALGAVEIHSQAVKDCCGFANTTSGTQQYHSQVSERAPRPRRKRNNLRSGLPNSQEGHKGPIKRKTYIVLGESPKVETLADVHWRCGDEEETSFHILCECPALAVIRYSNFGAITTEPKGVTDAPLETVLKETGLME
ncbi:hypothetical protein NQ318_018056 [Aromia moschata]|uniref:Endonuclease/exonuclease/phosphatase domain-containing protein n=1 Tax=Aromia moschata TaxID=1265417 RepID=A0AAV8ZEI2_9CUCU|nr:hypothetical protein NQ318_018056 [Aromia moschata]